MAYNGFALYRTGTDNLHIFKVEIGIDNQGREYIEKIVSKPLCNNKNIEIIKIVDNIKVIRDIEKTILLIMEMKII